VEQLGESAAEDALTQLPDVVTRSTMARVRTGSP
jgi:hypothetical protein